MTKMVDLTSKRFGRLVALEVAGVNKSKNKVWRCACDCGAITIASSSNLIRGVTTSCGCYKAERQREANIRHGQHGTGAHTSWMSMRQRCLNPKCPAFPSYGGRGITICPRWDRFENFLDDMGQRPHGLELDRIDVNGNYEPSNCRWATQLQQGRNQRKTRFATINGATKPLTEWADHYGINRKTLETRLRAGWPVEDALSRPKMHNGGRPAGVPKCA